MKKVKQHWGGVKKSVAYKKWVYMDCGYHEHKPFNSSVIYHKKKLLSTGILHLSKYHKIANSIELPGVT